MYLMFAAGILLILPPGGEISAFWQVCKWLLMETCVTGCPGAGSFLLVQFSRIGAQAMARVAFP